MKRFRNQSGSIDLILIAVVFVLATALGGYVYYQQQQAKKAETAAGTGVIVATQNNSALSSARVLAFYNAYAGTDLGGKDPKLSLDQLQAKGYITAAAVARLNAVEGIDPVLCTQGGSDQPIKVGTPSITGTTAKVTVSQNYTGSGTSMPNYMYVQLTKTGAWVISGIACTK